MTLRHTLLATFIACTGIYGHSDDLSKFEGLSGRALADAVRAEYKPLSIPGSLPTAGTFSTDWPGQWWPATWAGDGSRIALIVPEKWSDAPIYDLYNLVGGDNEFVLMRDDYPPGNLDKTTSGGKGWNVGTMTIAGYETNAWQPDDDRRGDLARRLMYMALMYPHTLWHGRASMFMADGEWPLLNTYARQLLEAWSTDDPVDERELKESADIAAAQGNDNPFLVIPGLFGYLWGDDVNQGFIPDDKRERTPLRGEYSRSADGFIDLYSPYVPEGASWQVDGSEAEGDVIDLQKLSTGVHIISYTTSSGYGKIKVKILP